jgi:polyisoprenoid-binding protein YceI
MNMSMFTARFDTVAGKLTLDPAAPTKSALNVSIDTNSVDTGLKGADAGFDAKIAEVLGAGKTPHITFVSRTITRTGPRTGLVSGDLTMNGVTKPAVLETTFENYAARTIIEPKPTIAFSAHAVIKRSDWGATNSIFSLFASDDVELIVESEMIKD